MKRAMAVLAALALAANAWALPLFYSSGKNGLSITQTNRTITFTDNHSGGTNVAFKARWIMVRSAQASASTCFVDFMDGTATTADVPIAPGGVYTFPIPPAYSGLEGMASIGAICDTAGTATWYVEAVR